MAKMKTIDVSCRRCHTPLLSVEGHDAVLNTTILFGLLPSITSCRECDHHDVEVARMEDEGGFAYPLEAD